MHVNQCMYGQCFFQPLFFQPFFFFFFFFVHFLVGECVVMPVGPGVGSSVKKIVLDMSMSLLGTHSLIPSSPCLYEQPIGSASDTAHCDSSSHCMQFNWQSTPTHCKLSLLTQFAREMSSHAVVELPTHCEQSESQLPNSTQIWSRPRAGLMAESVNERQCGTHSQSKGHPSQLLHGSHRPLELIRDANEKKTIYVARVSVRSVCIYICFLSCTEIQKIG